DRFEDCLDFDFKLRILTLPRHATKHTEVQPTPNMSIHTISISQLARQPLALHLMYQLKRDVRTVTRPKFPRPATSVWLAKNSTVQCDWPDPLEVCNGCGVQPLT